MNRRQAISSVAMLLGGTIIGSEIFTLTGCTSAPEKLGDLFNADDISLLDEIADIIIPETDIPGAKAVKTGSFMAMMVKDCYTPENQKVFADGLKKVDELSNDTYKADFAKLTGDNKIKLLTSLDNQQKEYTKTKKKEDAPHFFRMMKELTLLSFYTSEIGGTKALKYIEVPGRYDGCIPYKKGDPVYLNP